MPEGLRVQARIGPAEHHADSTPRSCAGDSSKPSKHLAPLIPQTPPRPAACRRCAGRFSAEMGSTSGKRWRFIRRLDRCVEMVCRVPCIVVDRESYKSVRKTSPFDHEPSGGTRMFISGFKRDTRSPEHHFAAVNRGQAKPPGVLGLMNIRPGLCPTVPSTLGRGRFIVAIVRCPNNANVNRCEFRRWK
jgi:hypothetical protein